MENLEYLCGLLGRRAGVDIVQALGIAGLAGYEDTPARNLSAGQRRRLALARLWLSPAELWLLDEPYANLDLPGIELVNRSAPTSTRAARPVWYAAPPIRTRLLVLERRRIRHNDAPTAFRRPRLVVRDLPALAPPRRRAAAGAVRDPGRGAVRAGAWHERDLLPAAPGVLWVAVLLSGLLGSTPCSAATPGTARLSSAAGSAAGWLCWCGP